jgi:hypothetical protein
MGSKLLLLMAVAMTAMSAAAAPVDSLFSEESVEVRADERLFTLFLVMNGLGWSEAAQYGPAPLKEPRYDGIRQDLLAKLATYRERYLPNATLNRARRFVEANPAALRDYVEAALHISPAPEMKMAKSLPQRLAKLRGLGDLLRSTWKEARVSVLMGRYSERLGEAQRRLLDRVDKRTRPLMAMLKAKTVAVKKKSGSDDDSDDLFGSDDDDSSASAEDATGQFESVAASVVPLWKRGEMLAVRVGDRFELVFGGERGNGVEVALRVALARLRSAAGLHGKPIDDGQTRLAWGLVTAATGRQGLDTHAPYPGCVAAIQEWRTLKAALTEADIAKSLLDACTVKETADE